MPRHDLYKLWWARVLNATYHAMRSLCLWFWRSRFLKEFYHIWACHRLEWFLRNPLLKHFPMHQNRPCHKLGHSQCTVLICINYDGPNFQMLHTKFQGHRPFSSGEEDFWRGFTIYGHGGHLGHVTQILGTNFRSPIPLRLHMKFGFNRGSGFRGEDVWKSWQQMDGLTEWPWPLVTISSSGHSVNHIFQILYLRLE